MAHPAGIGEACSCRSTQACIPRTHSSTPTVHGPTPRRPCRGRAGRGGGGARGSGGGEMASRLREHRWGATSLVDVVRVRACRPGPRRSGAAIGRGLAGMRATSVRRMCSGTRPRLALLGWLCLQGTQLRGRLRNLRLQRGRQGRRWRSRGRWQQRWGRRRWRRWWLWRGWWRWHRWCLWRHRWRRRRRWRHRDQRRWRRQRRRHRQHWWRDWRWRWLVINQERLWR
mmetsp:Transcript_8568/g.26009  ORF Transcript_8568/g.26009 Transcript_8568/m.26009 type:complete len:227 (+) Transcript_8568:180-860(+)